MDVWGGLRTEAQFQNARGAAELVYRLVQEAHDTDPGFEDKPETVLAELGVPASVVKAIAHEQHEDTKEKAALIEAFDLPDGLVMEWPDSGEDLRFSGFVGWAGENEDALIRDLKDLYFETESEVEAYYGDCRGYAQLSIIFHYGDMTPGELEEVLGVIGAYRKEGMGGVLYEDAVAVDDE
jgi:hypothetical protein